MRSLLGATSLHAMVAATMAIGVAAPLAVAQAQMVEHRVEFALGSAQLDSAARQVISQAADDFQSGDASSITLVGHTDTTASAALNRRLSERRAAAVEAALVEEGVSPGAIQVNAVGESQLIVPTADGVALQANRVVTISMQQPMQAEAPAEPPMMMVEEEPVEEFKNFAIELGPYYGYDMQSDNHMVGANLSIDVRINPYITIGGEQAAFWVINESGYGGRSVASLDLGVGSLANLGGFGQVIPYIGANAGMIYGEEVEDSFIYGPEIGIDLGFVTAKVAYDIRDDGLDDGIISATIGGLIRF